jgi:cobalt-zinc-cadmium efflux system membrane fusion protein
VQVGEVTSEEPLFTIVDLSQVWVELDIFARDVGKVKVGQAVNLETLDGITAEGVIDWLAPLSSHASQSIHARVPIHNSDGKFRPGQFVSAKVTVATRAVPLAVKRSAVQRFRDFQVVYARFGEIYEVRMLEAGPGNEEWLEIIGGLASGTEYVTENSYLIKADIEKSGATHDH